MLTPSDLLALQWELRQAFTAEEFRQLLADRFGLRTEWLVSDPSNPGLQAREVIEVAERAGWIDELIRAAFDVRPGNLELGRLYRDAGFAPAVQTSDGLSTIPLPLDRLHQSAEIQSRVCRIEVGSERLGTGFLVGPDAVLTANFVLRDPDGEPWRLSDGEPWKLSAVRCRFDYRASDTGSVGVGTPVSLKPGAEVIHSSPNPTDFGYSLLRLERPIGLESAGPGGTPRGWFRLPAEVTVSPGRRTLIFYYPRSGPLKIGVGATAAFGPVDPPEGHGPVVRVRYAVPLEGGASGAPCLGADGNVFALHLGRWRRSPIDPPDLRFGLSAAAVLADLKAAGKDDALGAELAATARPADPHPPRPGPITVENDPQKGRWGGLSARSGRKLSADISDVGSRRFTCSLTVESTDGTELDPPVMFHLHDSFPRMVIHIKRIRDGVRAVLEDVVAYGAFTVGAQVKDACGNWIGLEYDLVDHPDVPERLHDT